MWIKEVPFKTKHYCPLPIIDTIDELKLHGPGSIWRCDECDRTYTLTYINDLWTTFSIRTFTIFGQKVGWIPSGGRINVNRV